MALDLKELERRLADILENETTESFEAWVRQKKETSGNVSEAAKEYANKAQGTPQVYEAFIAGSNYSPNASKVEEERPEIAYRAFKRMEFNESEGSFASTWINGYCQALRDYNIGK